MMFDLAGRLFIGRQCLSYLGDREAFLNELKVKYGVLKTTNEI